jgi:LysR family nitrogen assimilation transcriptional regulator
MDVRQIRYFIALYEEHSITAAAKRLNVVQPAVSTQIRRMEAAYGVALFERTPRGVYPTAVAKALYPACVKMAAEADQIEQSLRKASGTITGTVTLGISPSLAQGLLPQVLASYCAQYPSVHVRCYEGYSATLAEWIWNGVLDFAILNAFESDRRLKTRHLLTEDLYIVASKECDPPLSGDIAASELGRFKVILPTGNNSLRILLDSALERCGGTLAPALEIDSLTTVLRMVRRSGWASIVPGIALRRNPDADALSFARLVEPAVQRSIVVAFDPSKEPSVAGEKLIACVDAALHEDEG